MRGAGVRARKDLEPSEYICEYRGDLIKGGDGKKREEKYKQAGDGAVGSYSLYFTFDSRKWW
jgi:hypothetical protein